MQRKLFHFFNFSSMQSCKYNLISLCIFLLGIGRVLSSRAKFGEKIVVTNGDRLFGHMKYDLDIRVADKIDFYKKSYDIFNGENYLGLLLIKNHLQLDKVSNLVSIYTLQEPPSIANSHSFCLFVSLDCS